MMTVSKVWWLWVKYDDCELSVMTVSKVWWLWVKCDDCE